MKQERGMFRSCVVGGRAPSSRGISSLLTANKSLEQEAILVQYNERMIFYVRTEGNL
jgi:hypothetical protein